MDGWWTFIDDDLWWFHHVSFIFWMLKNIGMMILYFSRHIFGMGWKPAGTESRTGWFSIASFHCRSASTWWKFTKTSGVKVPEDQWTKTRGFTLNTGEFHSTYSYPRGVFSAISGLRVWTVSLLHHKQEPPSKKLVERHDCTVNPWGPWWIPRRRRQWPCMSLAMPWQVGSSMALFHGVSKCLISPEFSSLKHGGHWGTCKSQRFPNHILINTPKPSKTQYSLLKFLLFNGEISG